MLIYFFISLVFYSHWRIHSVSSSLKRWLCNSKTHHVCVCLIRSESNVTYKSTSIWALTIPFARSLSNHISVLYVNSWKFQALSLYCVFHNTNTHRNMQQMSDLVFVIVASLVRLSVSDIFYFEGIVRAFQSRKNNTKNTLNCVWCLCRYNYMLSYNSPGIHTVWSLLLLHEQYAFIVFSIA